MQLINPGTYADKQIVSETNTYDALAQYEDGLASIFEKYLNASMATSTLVQLENDIRRYQKDFLSMNPEYCALSAVSVVMTDANSVTVNAPIAPQAYKRSLDARKAEVERFIAEQENLARQREAKRAKALAQMRRRHRKLMAKYSECLPYGIKSIWGTLTVSQQYSLLKAMDYEARHADTH
jgi:hypothetical protein